MTQEPNTAADGAGEPGAEKSLRWSQDRRLEFLDFRLRWEGRINRSDLTSFFGISVPQATLDIREYLERAPGNAAYDAKTRGYLVGSAFKPLYPTNEPGRYLNELLARTAGMLPAELSFLGWTPPTVTVPAPIRTLEPTIVVSVLTAIRRGMCLKVSYQSMSKPEPTDRILAPHGVAFDGFRWHVRAYCHLRREFRDFVLARMLMAEVAEEAGTDGTDDSSWHQVVSLALAPNSRLPKATRRVIELDYGMVDGEVILECRQAVLFYALKRLGLLEPADDRPKTQQIVLRNRAAVMKFLPLTRD
ncbi:helix-turn-helix transcriptional regulator [Variovorax sp. JS1663]|uniref:helix-turn-helix transcriptional regulator n=1 Tax=Variovorax sp. JS1663 TaxID=1851577 RepID=UPI000B6AA4F7|nr:WYL domain-containing protein [Variovorax sp. JS1663]OUM02967.1 transcriptional regulator [Variovorax sp. JS1663]